MNLSILHDFPFPEFSCLVFIFFYLSICRMTTSSKKFSVFINFFTLYYCTICNLVWKGKWASNSVNKMVFFYIIFKILFSCKSTCDGAHMCWRVKKSIAFLLLNWWEGGVLSLLKICIFCH